ncbi:DUF4360 domain-containing protein [Nannocystis radixulma]|uniref:DUF4360 domain-containing protein n=1 Tax=Nannocystis radixulma TaxID=2995305 RepID=A0ABT5B339_9BACT|nr:DUF4360 domain-containing protein [Nannocystis radixulma]MDC0668080.1 DUF4360 domain-containing protein [Nannocystis radixulma]
MTIEPELARQGVHSGSTPGQDDHVEQRSTAPTPVTAGRRAAAALLVKQRLRCGSSNGWKELDMLVFDTVAEFPAYLVGLLGSLAPPGGPSEPDAAAEREVVAAEFDDDELYLEEVVADGSGCDDESNYSIAISPDKNSFMIMYNAMELENPSPDGDRLQTKNCLVSVRLHIPSGFQVGMASLVSRGGAIVAEGVTAQVTSRYWLAGDPVGNTDRAELAGPYDGYFEYQRDVPLSSVVWSPCGGPAVVTLDNLLVLDATKNPEGASEIVLDYTDIGISQRECEG